MNVLVGVVVVVEEEEEEEEDDEDDDEEVEDRSRVDIFVVWMSI